LWKIRYPEIHVALCADYADLAALQTAFSSVGLSLSGRSDLLLLQVSLGL